MLPAHEYGYIPYTNYYTDTMGTLRRNYMKRSIFLSESGERKKRLTSQSGCLVNIQNKPVYLPRYPLVDTVHHFSCRRSQLVNCCLVLLEVSFTYEMYAPWRLPNGLNAQTDSPHTHTQTHISLISQETPLYLATADCELLSNAGFHWEVL